MKKIYILVPLIGALVFGGFYWNFAQKYDAQVAARNKIAAEALEAKKKHEVELHQQAVIAANEAMEKRRKEIEAKKAQKEERTRARNEAEENRQRAFDDRKRLRETADNLKKDLDGVKAEIAKLEEEKKKQSDELVFLQDFIKKTDANQKFYYDLLDKIAEADKAAAKAAADAKAAAAANKG
jgi:colicin import membrane protein